MVWRWWWPSGAITPAISALNEAGGMMRGRRSGKGGVRFGEERGWMGWWPGVAVRRCSDTRYWWRPARGRRREGCGGGLGRPGGQGPRGVGVARPSRRTGPKSWARPIWLLG
jgi:hypothetical protein